MATSKNGNKDQKKQDPDKTRLNVEMPRPLYRKIKVQCAEEDMTITEMTINLWRNYLEGKEREERERRRIKD